MSISLSKVFNKKEERLFGRCWVGEGELAGIQITLASSHLDGMWFSAMHSLKMAVSQGRDVSSVRCIWAGKSPSGPGDLNGLKEIMTHFMRSWFEILAMLWSSRVSSM